MLSILYINIILIMNQFDIENKAKEVEIQQLIAELTQIKGQIRNENRIEADFEEQEDELDVQTQQLKRQLNDLDFQLEELESQAATEDDDILIQKLEQESAFLTKMLASCDEETEIKHQEIQSYNEQNRELEMQISDLQRRLGGMKDVEHEVAQLQTTLSDSIEEERIIFEQNLKLLNELKDLENLLQDRMKDQLGKEMHYNVVSEHYAIERRSVAFDISFKNLEDKLFDKEKIATILKYRIEKALDIISDFDLRKAVGIDQIKIKVDKFDHDFKEFMYQVNAIKEKKKQANLKIFVKDIKAVQQDLLRENVSGLKELENDVDLLIQQENDLLDIERLSKQFLDFEREVESEFIKKLKTLNDSLSKSNSQLNAITQEDLSYDKNLNILSTYQKLKKITYEIHINPIQDKSDLNQQWVIIKIIEDFTQSISKEIKLFYQLQFLSQFNSLITQQEQRLLIKNKMKRVNENISELDKQLQENGNLIENISKEASYLKESEFSPVKGRPSLLYGSQGDYEKEQELISQQKQVEGIGHEYEQMKQERDKLKKSLIQYQQKFDDLDLEQNNLIKFEELIDQINNELDFKTQELKQHSTDQINQKLNNFEVEVEERVQKFKNKRNLLQECKQLEKEKKQEILKADSLIEKNKNKQEKIEKSLVLQDFNSEQGKPFKLMLDELHRERGEVNKIVTEIEKYKGQMKEIGQDLNSIGDKLITQQNLEDIMKKLNSMERIKQLNEDLKKVNDSINQKEIDCEKLSKSILGSQLFDCEHKFKEAEQLLEKLQKQIMETNNNQNDFELDVKKGIQAYIKDDDLNKHGKIYLDENNNDRKDLKQIEEQKNIIKKVLHKIKNNLNDSDSQQQKLNAQALQEYIGEINTCLQKCGIHLQEVNKLDENLEKRKEEWNKLLNLIGSKDALIDDFEKLLQDNIHLHSNLSKKVQDIDRLIIGLEQVGNCMIDNPDYELRKPKIKKMLDQLQVLKAKKQDIQVKLKNVEKQINSQKEAKEKGLKQLSVDQLQELGKQGEENNDTLNKETKVADQILKDLQRKREKLGDGDIIDNFRNRMEGMQEVEQKVLHIAKDSQELEKILLEASKINPQSQNESTAQVKEIKREIDQTNKDKNLLVQQLLALKEKLKSKDLNRDDPSLFAPIINEIKELKRKIQEKDDALTAISKRIKFLKNKHGNVDIQKKFEDYKLKAENFSRRLQAIADDAEVLRDLFEDFDGYTSDTPEEDFIDRLGVDIKEIGNRHIVSSEMNSQLIQKIVSVLQNINQWQITEGLELDSKEIEKRAQFISQIEEESYYTRRMVEDLEYKVDRNKKVFMTMSMPEKLSRRELEVVELQKRVNQFEGQTQDVDLDIQQEIYQIRQQQNTSEEQLNVLEEIGFEVQKMKDDYMKTGFVLKKIYQEIYSTKDSKQHQFQLLKANIKIKKDILAILYQVKQMRQLFITLKTKFDTSKPKKAIAYKPIKGDYVDQLLADWINNNNCPVPISRLGNGFYMFGTKKIFAKIINGKLVIRVGGGYMGIDEFMFYYGAQELNKMLAYEDLEGDEEIDFGDVAEDSNNKSDILKQFHSGKTVIGSQAFKKRLSPRPFVSPRGPSGRGASGRGGSPSAQAQQKRSQQSTKSPRGDHSPRNQMERSPSSKTVGSKGINDSVYGGSQGGSFLKQNAQKNVDESSRVLESVKEKRTYK